MSVQRQRQMPSTPSLDSPFSSPVLLSTQLILQTHNTSSHSAVVDPFAAPKTASRVITFTMGSLFIIFCIIIFVLSIWKRVLTRQPFYSRGVSTIFAIIVYVVAAISIMVSEGFVAYNSANSPSCFINVFVLYPVIYILFSLYFTTTFRYLVLKRMQVVKQRVQKQMTSEHNLQAYMILEGHARKSTLKMGKRSFLQVVTDAMKPKSSFIDPNRSRYEMRSMSVTDSGANDSTASTTTSTTSSALPSARGSVIEHDTLATPGRDDGIKIYRASKLENFLKILRIMTSGRAIAAFIVIGLVIYYVLILALIFSNIRFGGGIICSGIQFGAASLFAIYILVSQSAFILLLFIDCTGNLGMICCTKQGIRKFFAGDDPFYFRLEFLLTVAVSTFFIIIALILVASIDTDSATFVWVEKVLIFSFLFCIACIVPGFSLILTIAWDAVRAKHSKAQQQEDFKQRLAQATASGTNDNTTLMILKCKETLVLVKKFAEREFSVENVLFWEDVQKFKKIIKPQYHEKRYKFAKSLYNTYLKPDSPLEINIDKKPRQEVKQALADYEKDKKDVGTSLFERTEFLTELNLADVLSRFFRTPEFNAYLNSKNV